MKGKILTISAHPDDWELGCYATIERLKREGCECNHVVLGKGRDGELDNKFDKIELLHWVRQVELHVAIHKPDVIFTHYANDLNIDHVITCKAVITACRPLPDYKLKEIYQFEVLSSTEWALGKIFNPNVFIEATENDIIAKSKAIREYQDEAREYPHPRSDEAILSLAMARGSQCGKELAEAFKVVRIIV